MKAESSLRAAWGCGPTFRLQCTADSGGYTMKWRRVKPKPSWRLLCRSSVRGPCQGRGCAEEHPSLGPRGSCGSRASEGEMPVLTQPPAAWRTWGDGRGPPTQLCPDPCSPLPSSPTLISPTAAFSFFLQSPQDTYASREITVQQVRCPFCSVQPKFTDSRHTAFLPGKCPTAQSHTRTRAHGHGHRHTRMHSRRQDTPQTPRQEHLCAKVHRHTDEHTHAHRDTDMCTQHIQAQAD